MDKEASAHQKSQRCLCETFTELNTMPAYVSVFLKCVSSMTLSLHWTKNIPALLPMGCHCYELCAITRNVHTI